MGHKSVKALSSQERGNLPRRNDIYVPARIVMARPKTWKQAGRQADLVRQLFGSLIQV